MWKKVPCTGTPRPGTSQATSFGMGCFGEQSADQVVLAHGGRTQAPRHRGGALDRYERRQRSSDFRRDGNCQNVGGFGPLRKLAVSVLN
jgi:hypothetical protein